MKKRLSFLAAVCVVFALAACGGAKQESQTAQTETQMKVQTETAAGGDQTEDRSSEDEKDSRLRDITVTLSVDGWGNIAFARGEDTPEADMEIPSQYAEIRLEKADSYTLLAWPDGGNRFVKWTRDGEDFSTDSQITVMLDESMDFIAVFEEDADWQNPVTDLVGEYRCDKAYAAVESFGDEEAWIAIDSSSSATDLTHWDIIGPINAETMTIEYSGATKATIRYDEKGYPVGQDMVYEDGTGTITFGEDGTLIWHEDQSGSGEDLVFERVTSEE